MKAYYNSGVTDKKEWSSLPPQLVPGKTKLTRKWGTTQVDSIISMSSINDSKDGKSRRQNAITNYDLVNSRITIADFKSVMEKDYKMGDVSVEDSDLRAYNIIRQKIETLKGEELKKGIQFMAAAVNGEAVEAKNAKKQQAITQAILARMAAEMQGQVDEEGQPLTTKPSDIARNFESTYINPTEVASNQIMKFLIRKDDLAYKFVELWEHGLISAESIGYVGVVDGHPSCRVCNTINVDYEREGDNSFIHKGDWAVEKRQIPKGMVLDLWGNDVTPAERKRIDNGMVGDGISSNGEVPGFGYSFEPTGSNRRPANQNDDHLDVYITAWRSQRKVGYLTYLDPMTQSMETTKVDEYFVAPPEMENYSIEWKYETEIWQGVRIGEDIYPEIAPLQNQTGNLPYVGYIFNNLNSVATSFVDFVKPHQYMYIICWHRIEQEIAKAKGKKFIMDIAQMPKSKGWTIDQWMYYFDEHSIAWINSAEEGEHGPNMGGGGRFNQFQSVDMTLSQSVTQYMQILNKLEQQIETISGVSPQREGDIGKGETATGAQRAIIQSTNVTKPMEYYFDLVKQEILTQMLELAKVTYIDGAQLEWITDEQTRESLKVDSGMLLGTDLGVFVTHTSEEFENVQEVKGYLSMALQSQGATLEDAVSILGSKSVSEIRGKIQSAQAAKNAREDQQAEAQNNAVVQAQEVQAESKREEQEGKMEIAQLNADKDIKVAIIQADSKDAGDDGFIDSQKLALDSRKLDIAERTRQDKVKEVDKKDKQEHSKIAASKQKANQTTNKSS